MNNEIYEKKKRKKIYIYLSWTRKVASVRHINEIDTFVSIVLILLCMYPVLAFNSCSKVRTTNKVIENLLLYTAHPLVPAK